VEAVEVATVNLALVAVQEDFLRLHLHIYQVEH
jgi:hypothetical protein